METLTHTVSPPSLTSVPDSTALEIVTFTLRPGKSPFPFTSDENQGKEQTNPNTDTWSRILDTLSTQHGFRSQYFGQSVEHPDTVQLLIEWDSLKDHQSFMLAPAYGPMLASFQSLAQPADGGDASSDDDNNDGLSVHHAHLHAPFAPLARPAAPVTEMLTVYLPPSTYGEGSAGEKEWEGAYRAFKAGLQNEAKGFVGVEGGWIVEPLAHEKLAGEEEGKGRAFLMAVGWESVEAHMAYRETGPFKETIEAFRERAAAMEMHHVRFQKG